MNRFEREIEAIKRKQKEHVEAFQAIYAKADSEDRATTEDENAEIQRNHRQIREEAGRGGPRDAEVR
jgi:hypothetical protein